MRTRDLAYISYEENTHFMNNFLKTKGMNDLHIADEARYLSSASSVMRKNMPIELKNRINLM
jgi:hypothetical protein